MTAVTGRAAIDGMRVGATPGSGRSSHVPTGAVQRGRGHVVCCTLGFAPTNRAGFPIPYNHLMSLSTPSTPHAAIGAALADVPHGRLRPSFSDRARAAPAHAGSDVDVALGFRARPAAGSVRDRRHLFHGSKRRSDRASTSSPSRIAPPGLAYRVFRDGVAVLVRDRSALVERKTRAILEYLGLSAGRGSVQQGGAGASLTVIAHSMNHVEDLLRLCDTLADAAIDGSPEP